MIRPAAVPVPGRRLKRPRATGRRARTKNPEYLGSQSGTKKEEGRKEGRKEAVSKQERRRGGIIKARTAAALFSWICRTGTAYTLK